MPIRFRCPGCEGLLSIATRKAGAEIDCPKCGEALIVPPPPDAGPVALAPAPEPAGVGAGPQPRKGSSRSARGPRPAGAADPPLFERSDFEALLSPKKDDREKDPLPDPAPRAADAPAADPAPAGRGTSPATALRQGLPVADDGVYVARSSAVMLGLGLVLLALAFAAGFLIGSR